MRSQTSPAQEHPTPTPANARVYLVATDGHNQSDAAFTMGSLFAERGGSVKAVSVLEPIYAFPDGQPQFADAVERSRRADLKIDIDAQMLRTLGHVDRHEVRDGETGPTIAALAKEFGATMIVAGVGQHRATDRVFGTETVLRLMRTATTPVFATASDMRHLPKRIVVAIDFSDTSVRAVRTALTVAATDATVFLTHVAPRARQLHNWQETQHSKILERLELIMGEAGIPVGMSMKPRLLQGDPATELLAFAKKIGADLIVTGSHGQGFMARLVVGSVATRMVRQATCSVLAVPHCEPDAPADDMFASSHHEADWRGVHVS